MVMRKMDAMVLRMIRGGKGQFFAVLTIITLGLAVYTALNMTAVNMQNTVDRYYEENRFADFFLQTGNVPSQALHELKDLDGVLSVMGRITIDVPFISEDPDERVNLRLVSDPGREMDLSQSTLLSGNPLSGRTDEILLVKQFATARGIGPGDQITLQIKGKRQNLRVVGIVANPEYVYMMENEQSIMPAETSFGVGYVNEMFARQAAGMAGGYNEVLVDSREGTDEEQLIDDLEDRLDSFGVKRTVKRKDQLSNSILTQELTNLDKMASSLPILFLGVAALMLAMMLGRMVKKDRIKIGVMKAIGYSNRQILVHYVKYALAAGIGGGALGSALGLAMAGGMTKLYLEFFNIPLLQINFNLLYVGVAMGLSATFCVIAGIIGARGILKISPADSMREEAPKKGRRIALERVTFLWKRLTFSNKLVLKNTFRKKRRALFVMTGIMVTYAMMLFTTSMPTAVDQLTTQHFREFQKMDYSVAFYAPVDKRAVYDLGHVIEAEYMEGKLEYPFELLNGNHKKAVPIIGLAKNTRFYSFRDMDGNSLPVPEEGILLSENLAKAIRVDAGDTVVIHTYLPNRDDVSVTVQGVIKQSLGMNAYMNLDRMGSLLLEPGIINGVYLDTKDAKLYEKIIRLSNVATVMSSQELMDVYLEYMKTIILTIGVMVVFSGILGFSIVYNTTIISIGERELEFSSLRVLGFSKLELFVMLLKETGLISTLGILLGIPLGIAFAQASSAAFSTDLYTLDLTPTMGSSVAAAAFTLLFIVLAQAMTYRKLTHLDFLQALKNRIG